MQPELVLVHTSIRYHGSPITVMGRPDTGLLVVADFDTPAARAIGLITTATGATARSSIACAATPRT
jgi:hypothetical protein